MIGNGSAGSFHITQFLNIIDACISVSHVYEAFLHALELTIQAVVYFRLSGLVEYFYRIVACAIACRQVDGQCKGCTIVFSLNRLSVHQHLIGRNRPYYIDAIGTLLGHVLIRALTLSYVDCQLVFFPFGRQLSTRVLVFIQLVVAVVFIEREGTVATGEYGQTYSLIVVTQVFHSTVERKDSSSLYIYRIFIQSKCTFYHLSSLQKSTSSPFIPVGTFRQPNLDSSIALFHRRSNRSYQHVIAEHILSLERVSFLSIRIIVVHRATQRNTVVISLTRHGIYIRSNFITHQNGLTQYIEILLTERPRLFVHGSTLHGVSTHNGTKGTKLHPAYEQFAVELCRSLCKLMTTQVMTPVTIEYIRCGSIEIRLEGKRLPGAVRVTGETNLVTVIAQTAPAMVQQRTRITATLHVAEKDIVQPPCIVQILDASIEHILLPVEPPEIDTFFFHRTQDGIQPSTHETLVGATVVDALLFVRVHAHPLGHFGIFLLVRFNAASRMQIQCYLQSFTFHIVEELGRIGEQRTVPRIACPSTSSRVHVMPVHIYNQHIQRNLIRFELVDQVAQLVV